MIKFYGKLNCCIYFSGKTKKKGSQSVAYDPELADGLVDFDKIKKNMESAVEKLQHDFTTKINIEMKSGKSNLVVR